VSETDTEVIPKLCRYVYASLVAEAQRASSTGGGSATGAVAAANADAAEADDSEDSDNLPPSRPPSGPEVVPFPRLVMEVLKRLEGAYAILVRSSHYPGELVACKRGSPLILGVKEEDSGLALDGQTESQAHGQAHRHMAAGPRAEAGAGVSKTAGTHSAAAAAPVPAAAVAKAATTTPSCAAAASPGLPTPSLPPAANGARLGDTTANGRSHASNHPLSRSGSFARVADSYNRATWAPHLECWVASDASAVVEHTRRVIVLEDGDVLHVCGGGWGIYNLGAADVDAAVPRALQTLQVEVDQIMKGGYDHFMLKEIHEQPEALVQTMRGRVLMGGRGEGKQGAGGGAPAPPPLPSPYASGPRIKLGGLVETADVMRRSRRIMFVACGTSYHSCLAARSTVEEMTDAPVVLELASDLLDREGPIFRDDTCVFVSQSGETADTLRALEYAKSRGALCVGVTNTVGSAISRATHCGVHQNAGYEIGVASTKAYTSQIVCVTMMALALAEDSISKRGRRDEIISALAELPDKIRRALKLDGQMRALAQQLNEQQSNSLLFFARGANYATALEAALKVSTAGRCRRRSFAFVRRSRPIPQTPPPPPPPPKKKTKTQPNNQQ
jgi:glucosamine 6-phosphate synthetase-like amidotransferase/phosphosugar isomerase protein